MSKPTTRFLKQQIIIVLFVVFVSGCVSLMPLDKTTEKPITDMKSIVGKWDGVTWVSAPWLILPAFFPTVVFLEDGRLIAQSSSNYGEFGPYLYKGYLHNGKFCTRSGGEYTLYERDGERVLIYRFGPFVETKFKYIDNSTTLPSKKIFLKDYN